MTRTFTQFLREQVALEAAEAERNRGVVDEWRAAIEQLFGTMRGWLSESDPDHIVQIEQKQHEVREEGLGRYVVPRLVLQAFGTWVGIIPKARNTVGMARPPQKAAPGRATGRIDITDEVRRFVLYRFPNEGGGDLWVIDDLRSEQKALDQQGFEAALMSYFR